MIKDFVKRLSVMITILVLAVGVFASAIPVKADMEYMTSADACTFLAFIYNSDIERVTPNALKEDSFYKLLTGAYVADAETEKATAAAFLFFVDARIEYMLAKNGETVKSASSYLIDYFSEKLEEELPSLVSTIFKKNILNSVINLCGDDGDEIINAVEGMTNLKDSPENFIADVKALTSAFTYIYGQNIESLYTYFDAAISCVDLKQYEGAYETAMSANILMLKDSNIFGSISALIPGMTSWEDWIDEMDVWAQYVYDLRKYATSSNTKLEWHTVTFDSNCDEVEDVSYTYVVGISKLEEPEMNRHGYVFAGWYWDKECTESAAGEITIDRDIVVYAKWIDRYHTIAFDSCCDEVENYTYVYDILTGNWFVPDMEREGYVFGGWYWDKECTQLVDEVVIDSDKTFYARWITIYGYAIVNNSVEITGIKGGYEEYLGEHVKIPADIGGLPVTSIAKGAFRDKRNVKIFEIPSSVTVIGESAFQNCTNLETVYMGNSVTDIGKSAFRQNSKLKKVVLSNAVTNIGSSAFAYCWALDDIEISSSVRVIGESAFFQCKSLSKITLPDKLEQIGDNAFFQCALEEITIPDNVKEIGMNTFYGCSKLKTVTIGSGVVTIEDAFGECAVLESINVKSGNTALNSKDGVLFDKNMNTLYKYPCAKKALEYVVPDTVTNISGGAFTYCTAINKIVLPESVTELGDNMFFGSTALESVVLGEKVTSIGISAFGRCTALQNIVLPQSVNYIGSAAFEGCTALEKVDIPGGVGQVNYGVFWGCTSLYSVIIEEGVESIGYFAFSSCTALENVSLPGSLKIIDSSAFELCDNLNDVYYQSTAEDWNSVDVTYGNEPIENAIIHTITVKADVASVEQSDGKITGSIEYEYLENDTEVIVGLYKDGELVDTFKATSKSGSENLDFELEAVKDEYCIKVFFWGVEELNPLSDFIEELVK